ncbi:MAG: hypothetical protein ACT452_19380 [Microthrixaceae bacterium]
MPPGLASTDEEVVRNYVEALVERDIETAMDFRCTELRIADEDRRLFGRQLERLLDDIGPLSVAAIDPVPSSGLADGGEGRDPQEVQISLTSRGDPEGSPLVAVLLTQDGERRICGRSTPQAAGIILGGDHPALVDLGESDAPLEALLPAIEPEGYRLVRDEGIDPDPDGGDEWIESWERIWQVGEYGGAAARAERYPSAAEARESLRDQISEFLPDGVATFGVPDVEGAFGVRYLGYAWLGIQPPSQGPYIDGLYILMGDAVIVLTVSALPSGTTHDLVQELAAQVLERAGKLPNRSV